MMTHCVLTAPKASLRRRPSRGAASQRGATLRLLVQLCLAGLLAGTTIGALAQGLRLPSLPAAVPAGGPAVAGAQRPADYIVAVVNSEPITNYQVRLEVQRVARQLAQAQQVVPSGPELVAQVLERLISDRTQLHLAREYGIKVDEAAIDEAERNVARQNQIEVAEIYRRLAADGVERSQFRNQLRDQILITRVREREVSQKVRVSELEIDQYLRDQQKNQDATAIEVHIAHILTALPDDASVEQTAAAQARAQRVLDRARAGADFAALARELSDAPDAASGGQLGLRRADRYPSLFVDATRDLGVGGLTLVRSGAGFHVLKVIERRASGMPATTVVQTRAAHILLRPSAQLAEAAARQKLADFRVRILAGKADFATLARENSQDGSAEQGGDLGWAGPGQFVPEFEEAMNALPVGQISEPLVSRFGVHLIQVAERRTVPLSVREQRETVRAIVREKKLDEAYLAWVQDLRARAYVEMREPPG